MSASPKAIKPSVNGWNAEYLERGYTAWKRDPASVPEDMRRFFEGFDLAVATSRGAATEASGQSRVDALIDTYRREGHFASAIDPFLRDRPRPESLSLEAHGLSDADLDTEFAPGDLMPETESATLRDISERLGAVYCGPIAAEFMQVGSREEREWLRERIESTKGSFRVDKGQRAHIISLLQRADLFEKFCGKRYPGVKRFSLEGSESLIPMLDLIVERAGDHYNVEEATFGMSHRGRLNVLTNVLGKTYEQIFTEFEDNWDEDEELGGGDVKYHRGFSSNRILPSGRHIWLSMASNPSHLESVGSVVMGRCRAKQRLKGDSTRDKVLPVVMHGDAAVIAQGVVAELLNMSQVPAYTVGGTVHLVVNNLIGFTTGPEDGRSSPYCTDIAKMLSIPILHVNGEDPEACVFAAQLALDYRMRFKKDIFIDLHCYRLHGHNETDEAAFTQPVLYKHIRTRPSVLRSYAERLLQEGVINQTDMDEIQSSLEENLDRAYTSARKTPVDPTPDPGHRQWHGVRRGWSFEPVGTHVSREDLIDISHALGAWPDDFTPHPKLKKLLEHRAHAIENDDPIDWATAESLAVGSLLIDGVIVRMSGQDSRRGTFSHRHAVITDYETGEDYVPLNHIREMGVPGTDHDAGTVNDRGVVRQAKHCIYDSTLSEFGVLGFEYGFSLASPNILALWEAQFGDFVNGAQVIIDQFIASAEAKWHRWSGLTLLLPHGYEGQGPEHSSARLERFLKLCGRNNIQVAYPSTPVQYFHVLRRQVMRSFRKPLILMTPKSLLRLPAATSRADDFTQGHFNEILDDPHFDDPSRDRTKVRKLILCSGKVYYDLTARRDKLGVEDIAIVRVEQLYPLHIERIEEIVNTYPAAEPVWVQEEPRNMGAFGHMFICLHEAFGWTIPYIGRPKSATPATGSPSRHAQETETLLTDAVGAVPSVQAKAS